MTQKNPIPTKYAMQWHPTLNGDKTPEDYSAGSGKHIWWVCDNKHEYYQPIIARTKRNQGCPYCAGQKILAGYNDLATLFPNIAQEYDHKKNSILATQISPGTRSKVWWICPKEHEYYASVVNRTRHGRGCAICSNQKIVSGINDFKFLHPTVAEEWDYEMNGDLLPNHVSVGRREPVYWRCKLFNHSWKATIRGRIGRNHGCPVCSNRVVLQGYNDFATKRPESLHLWNLTKNKLKPTEVSAYSNVHKIWWICENLHEWHCVPNRMNHGKGFGNGCPQCTANSYVSKGESEVADFVKSLGIEVITTERSLVKRIEYDMHLPNQKILIEFNGLFWHSDAWKKPDYHYKKFKRAEEKGYKLIQIWEDDWRDKRDQVKSLLRSELSNERANDVKFGKSTLEEVKVFFENYSLNKFQLGNHYFGLYRENQLYSAMVAKETPNEIQLLCSASLNNKNSILSEVIRHFEEIGIRKPIYATTDNSYSTGAEYEKTGFKLEKENMPNYQIFDELSKTRKGKEEYNYNFSQKEGMILGEEGDLDKDLFVLNRMHKIWDSGTRQWVKE